MRGVTTLDITELRTFTAVTAFGGVRRAAEALHLSPAAVSTHIRRLERELNCRLVVAQGRGIGLTSDGEELAVSARAILHEHDEAVRALRGPRDDQLVVAASEHAAEFLVPTVVATLTSAFPHHDIQLRLTRSERVRRLAEDSRADIALMLARPSPGSVTVASLPLQWFGTDDAARDRVVLFARPCAVRDQAIAVLAGRRVDVVKEGADLTCVLTAARNGLGVTPLPRMGPPPEGLGHVSDLPPIPSVELYMSSSDRVDRRAQAVVLDAMRRALR
jgi:DNA-binding transcriptional LysR family regulator